MQKAILSVTLALAFGQATSQSYAGTWTAELAGQTYVRLELQITNGALGGRISLGNIEVDSGGEVKTALAAPNEFTPLFDVVLRDSVLSFSRKDGNDTDHFELRLVDNRAELHFIPSDADRAELAAMGVPVPKPIRLTRTGPGAVSLPSPFASGISQPSRQIDSRRLT